MSITNERTTKTEWIDWISASLREAAWAPIAVLIFYGVSFFLGLYDRYPTLDIPSHFMGGMAIAFFYRSAIRHSQKILGDVPFLIQVLFALTAAGTTAILWEFAEYISDYYLGTEHMHGLVDTLTDLFMGLSGALLLSVFHRGR